MAVLSHARCALGQQAVGNGQSAGLGRTAGVREPALVVRRTLPTVAAHHEAVGVAAFNNAGVSVALILSSDRRGRPVYPELIEGSKDEGVLTNARGPPPHSLLPIPCSLRTRQLPKTHRHA